MVPEMNSEFQPLHVAVICKPVFAFELIYSECLTFFSLSCVDCDYGEYSSVTSYCRVLINTAEDLLKD